MIDKEALFRLLDEKGIEYERYDHIPVFTVEEADQIVMPDYMDDTKNLLLHDSKGKQYYMVILDAHKSLNVNELKKTLGAKKLSFASADDLMRLTGLIPGSVTPFGVLNDEGHEIITIFDAPLEKAKKLGAHPNLNDCTILVAVSDIAMLIREAGGEVRFVELP